MPAATIVLTGFMGTGKSTVGRLLAERLDVPLVDTDTLIEQRHGLIADIFADHGADHFRNLEHDIARELSGTSGVISTGGKFMLDPRNAAEFADAHTFCLTASVDTIVQRVTHSDDVNKRPLLAGADVADRVARLLAERANAYGAFAQVDTEGKTPAAVVDEICARLSSDQPATAARTVAMSSFTHGNATIHYDLEGQPDGFPVLLIALGGMHSENTAWDRWSPWNPRTQLADTYRIIGMDQRNAGRSTAPVTADDTWTTYTRDQIALLDHLGIERCHVVGMCIGGPYIMNLLQHAPDRIASAVMLQPVGIEPDGSNRDMMYKMYDEWAEQLPADRIASDDALAGLRTMWDGDFVLTADEATVAATDTPMLIARGDDPYHPASTSERIAELAPNATLVHNWKTGDDLAAFNQQVRDFLAGHTT